MATAAMEMKEAAHRGVLDGDGGSGWEECVVVPVVPHSVAAILQMVGAPWFMVATPLQAVATLLRMVWMVAAPL